MHSIIFSSVHDLVISVVLLLKWRFYFTCVIFRDLSIAANWKGASRPLLEQSSASRISEIVALRLQATANHWLSK